MKQLSLVFFVIALFVIAACNKTQFTDVKILADDGKTYTAHVIQPRMTVPDTGEIIPIIKTESTTGWLYNSKQWSTKDAYKKIGGLNYREVVIGKVIEIIPPVE